jgi:hypothetical protein
VAKTIKMKGGTTTLKHTHAKRGETVEFDNGNSGFDLLVHFDSSPFLDSLGPSSFTVPAGGARTRTVSDSAVRQKHYPFTPSQKSARARRSSGSRRGDGPPNPPDVVVSG